MSSDDPPLLESYLEKKGHRIPSWHNRYFVFDPSKRTVHYFKSQKDAKSGQEPVDTLTITGIHDVPDRLNMRQHRFDFLCFNASKGDTMLAVSADTIGIKENWMAAVGDVVGKQDQTKHPRYSQFSAGQSISIEPPVAVGEASTANYLKVGIIDCRALSNCGQDGQLLCCTIVPLDSEGRELKMEKKRSSSAVRAGNSASWEHEVFVFGQTDEFERASVLLVKLKDEGGTDFGAVHIPLVPVLQRTNSEPTEEWYPLEVRKGMDSVDGEINLSIGMEKEPSNEDLTAVAQAMMNGVEISDRSYRLKPYKACFVGSEAITYMMSESPGGVSFSNAEEAILFGNCMLKRGIIKSVPYQSAFVNQYIPFYRFTAHEDGEDPTSAVPPPAFVEPPRAVSKSPRLQIADFDILKLLGTGAFGKVVLARHKVTEKTYAVKVLDKQGMSAGDKHNTWAERHVLNETENPFIAKLEFAFQSPAKLFMGMEYFSGGDLHHHMHSRTHGKAGKSPLGEPRARFYISEIVVALAHLHSLKIIYRDLKGENVMIAADGHIRLVDFGLAKENAGTPRSAHSLVGSPYYVSPEVLESFHTKKGYGKAVDWWSTGILLYEMLVGVTPFEARNRQQLYWNIANADLVLPSSLSESAQSLLKGLLNRDPHLRLGAWDEVPFDIMEHAYFSGLNWDALLALELQPPWLPSSEKEYLDKEFVGKTASSIKDVGQLDDGKIQDHFDSFTFIEKMPLSEVGDD